jgi:hypothetical protein
MTDTVPSPALAEPSVLLRAALVVVALIETVSAVFNVSGIFNDYGHTTQLLKFAQALTSVDLAIAPLIAGTALACAFIGKVRHAIGLLAIRMLASYILDMPSLDIHGLELSADFGGAYVAAYRFGYPLIAIAALMLAIRNERLALATFFVSLPTLSSWLGVVAFAIGIAVYGF